MKYSLIRDIKKFQLLNILTFGLLISILAGFLIWNQTIHYEKERLAILSGIITQKITDNLSLVGDEPGKNPLSLFLGYIDICGNGS